MPFTVADSYDDHVSGCVKYLISQATVLAVVGSYPSTSVPFIWRSEPKYKIEGSSSVGIVVTASGQWSPPNYYSTASFPRIGIEIYVDPQRDASGAVTKPGEAERRADYVFKVINKVLHRPQGGSVMFGTVRTNLCALLSEPVFTKFAEGDGMLAGVAYYGLEVA